MVQISFKYTEYSRFVYLYINIYRNIKNQFCACYTTVLPFSVNLVIEEAVNHNKRVAHRVRLYCDDLVLSPESEIEVVECFNMSKAAMERRDLKVDNGTMKIYLSLVKNAIL